MKKCICATIVIALLPLLSACAPTVFVVGAAAGGALIYDNRGMKTILEDRNISDKAQTRIDSNKELRDKTHISVATMNHVVLAVGQTPTQELRDKAIAIIQLVPNVKRIYNEITLEEPISVAAISNDAWLTAKIKTKLLEKKGLQSSQLKVITENGTAYLMGLVSHRQGELAADAAKKVPGVRKVVKVFEYVN